MIFIYGNVIIFKEHKDETEQMPFWGTMIGWGLAAIALVQIPLWFTIGLARSNAGGGLWARLCSLFTATADYGPTEEKTFRDWKQWKAEKTGKGGGGNFASNLDSSYSAKKSALFAATSGADNPAFVQDEQALSHNNNNNNHNSSSSKSNNGKGSPNLTFGGNIGGSSSHFQQESKADAFRQPQLLSSRSFEDNY